MSEEHNPYASPQAPVIVEPQFGDTTPAGPFRATQTVAQVVVVLLAVSMLVDLVAIASSFMEIQLLSSWAAGAGVDDTAANANDTRQMIVGLTQLGVLLITSICFFVWIFRSYKNLRALGARNLKYSAGWAIGSWFVPILNLVRPYQIMQEIWQHSDPARLGTMLGRTGGSSTLIRCWWALWIICGVLGQISFRLAMRADTLDMVIAGSWIDLATSAVSILCAVAIIVIIRAITANQYQRRSALATAAAPA